jgi:hypothetical protein
VGIIFFIVMDIPERTMADTNLPDPGTMQPPVSVLQAASDAALQVLTEGHHTLSPLMTMTVTYYLQRPKNPRAEGDYSTFSFNPASGQFSTLSVVVPATWTLRNHWLLCLPSMNRRVTVAIMCMRRALGGSQRVRPLQVFQILQRMKYVVVSVGCDRVLV